MPDTVQVIRVDDPSIIVRDGVAWWEGEPIDIRLGDVIELTEERAAYRLGPDGYREALKYNKGPGNTYEDVRRFISEWVPVDA